MATTAIESLELQLKDAIRNAEYLRERWKESEALIIGLKTAINTLKKEKE